MEHPVARDAGVVDQDVERPERLACHRDSRLSLSLVTDRTNCNGSLTTRSENLCRDRLRTSRVDVVHDDSRTRGRKSMRDPAPDAASGTSDERDAFCKPHHLPNPRYFGP